MKKVIVLMLVVFLAAAVTANAGLKIYVNLIDGLWAEYSDSKLTIVPSDYLQLGVIDEDGTGGTGVYAFGIAVGTASGSIDAREAIMSSGVTAELINNETAAAQWGIQNPFISLTNTTPQGVGGWLVQKFTFHCDGPGDVTLAIVDDDGHILDTQVIHQIPEPATWVILGLGSLVFGKVRRMVM